jgi:hypothetical protein
MNTFGKSWHHWRVRRLNTAVLAPTEATLAVSNGALPRAAVAVLHPYDLPAEHSHSELQSEVGVRSALRAESSVLEGEQLGTPESLPLMQSRVLKAGSKGDRDRASEHESSDPCDGRMAASNPQDHGSDEDYAVTAPPSRRTSLPQ